MISSIRLDGTTACMHLPGAADTAAFVTYIGEILCPTLKQGDIVVMDNLAVHRPVLKKAVINESLDGIGTGGCLIGRTGSAEPR